MWSRTCTDIARGPSLKQGRAARGKLFAVSYPFPSPGGALRKPAGLIRKSYRSRQPRLTPLSFSISRLSSSYRFTKSMYFLFSYLHYNLLLDYNLKILQRCVTSYSFTQSDPFVKVAPFPNFFAGPSPSPFYLSFLPPSSLSLSFSYLSISLFLSHSFHLFLRCLFVRSPSPSILISLYPPIAFSSSSPLFCAPELPQWLAAKSRDMAPQCT